MLAFLHFHVQTEATLIFTQVTEAKKEQLAATPWENTQFCHLPPNSAGLMCTSYCCTNSQGTELLPINASVKYYDVGKHNKRLK